MKTDTEIIEIRISKILDFLKPVMENLQGESDAKFDKASDILNVLDDVDRKINDIVDDIVDQAEEQIIDLKVSILALEEMLPIESLTKSGVYAFNTTKERFLNHLQDNDMDVLSDSELGMSIREIHTNTNLIAGKSVHGAFIFFPLGSQEKTVATIHARALHNFAQLAHRNCFQIYFNVDNPAVYGKETLAELPDRIKDWIIEYQNSAFFMTMRNDIPPHLKRRLCHVFNPYMIDTETLEKRFPKDCPPRENDMEIIDKCCWAPPVAFLAKRLVLNYEQLGWCGQLFGVDSMLSISSYRNPNPKTEEAGRCFTKRFQYRYAQTLWNYLNDLDFPKLRDDCLMTPLQRQIDDSGERIAILDAQTQLPQPPDFQEKNQIEYKSLPSDEKQKYDYKCIQKMTNSLSTVLLEDTICRGLILITRRFIGIGAQQAEQELKTCVNEYLEIFTGKAQQASEKWDYVPALKTYELLECGVSGQRASVSIRILPNEHIRNIRLGVLLSPSHLFGGAEEGGRER